ncbi:hypothetical protein JCM24511_05987 [Saitozyma sp. JCM 24511]|nr:hypothetical protein JCM24511_05987 [Saitozyma sp. JCM 24511]
MPLPSYPHPHAALQQAYHRLSNVFLHSYPVRDLPLNIRPAVIFATAAWLILLGILGMAPFPTLPINDKAMHFFGANLLGCTVFLYLAHMLHQRHRRRTEISTLYEPLSSSTYRDAQGREHAFGDTSSPTRGEGGVGAGAGAGGANRSLRGYSARGRQGSNVWDDADSDAGRPSGEDTYSGRTGGAVFGIGEDADGSGRAGNLV